MKAKQREKKDVAFVKKGQIYVSCEPGTKGAVENNGKFYLPADELEGCVVKIEVKPNKKNDKYAPVVYLHIADEKGENVGLFLFSYGSGYFSSFAKAAPNINFAHPVSITAIYSEDDGKKSSSLLIKQGGSYAKWAYVKDDMKDCPPAVKDAKGNWDFSDQNAWLGKKLKEQIESQAVTVKTEQGYKAADEDDLLF